METCLGFYHNNDFVERKLYDHIIIDYPDYLYTHHVGTLERANQLAHYYHGFIYSLKFWNVMVGTFMDEVSSECGDLCEVCPAESGTCLGVCNWHSYSSAGSGASENGDHSNGNGDHSNGNDEVLRRV